MLPTYRFPAIVDVRMFLPVDEQQGKPLGDIGGITDLKCYGTNYSRKVKKNWVFSTGGDG
jgi:hypothetical protein